MSVRRTRSVSKWKEVLGFDEGFYPTSETPPPYHRFESPGSIYESVGSISPTVSYYHETLEELTSKFHYSDAPEVVPHTPHYDDAPEAIDTPLDYTYSDGPEAVIGPSDAPEAVIKPSDAPEAVVLSPTSSTFSQTPISAITSRFNTNTYTYPKLTPTNTLSYTPISPSTSGIRFPRDLTFTRNSIFDILLSPSSPPASNNQKPLPTPPPLFYITIYQSAPGSVPAAVPQSNSNKPDIALHSSASPNSPLLAFACFNTVTLITDITTLPPPTRPLSPITPPSSSSLPSKSIVPPPTTYNLPTSPGDSLTFGVRSQGYKTEKLVPTGGIFTAERYAFHHTLPRTFVKEKFEWRQVSSSSASSAPHVGLATVPEEMTSKKGGVKMKLMRCSTGETLAVYVGVGNEDWADKERKRRGKKNRVLGMMRWLDLESGSQGLGDEFELMGVMSVLGVMERWRRVMNVQKQLGMFTS